MKYLILFIALSLVACKDDCKLECTFTIENDDGIRQSGTFNKSDELQCELTDSEYEAQSIEFIERNYVDPYNEAVISTNPIERDESHYYTMDCD